MEGMVSGFFTVEVAVFCIIIYLTVLGFRRGAEWLAKKAAYIIPDKYEAWPAFYWKKTVLPVLPVIFGVGLALLFPAYPFPSSFAASKAGLAALGFVCGLCNTWVYDYCTNIVKKLVAIKAESKE